jgi:hypothetical protein
MAVDPQTEFVTLAVTEPVLKQVQAGNDFQRQIAIKDASPHLLTALDKANSRSPAPIVVGGALMLMAHDTRAIWLSHQSPGIQADDFNALFALLSRRPGRAIRFAWA